MAGPLLLPSPQSFKYLSGSGAATTAEGISDTDDFAELR
jgi:hypothetical protein